LDRAPQLTGTSGLDSSPEGEAVTDGAAAERSQPPGPSQSEFLKSYRVDPVRTIVDMARSYGDVVHFVMRRRDAYLLSHPRHAQDILVTNHAKFIKGPTYQELKWVMGEGMITSEGEFHRWRRRMAQPAVHHQRLLGYSRTMSEISSHIQDRWTDGEEVDVDFAMMQLALGVVCKTLFDVDAEEEDGLVVRDGVETLNRGVNFFITAQRFTRMEGPIKAVIRLNEMIYRFIEDHRSGGDRGDLLSMLLAAVDEEDPDKRLTNDQVRDELVTLILAGHETTASTLTWTFHLLSQHPEAERRLHEEIDSVLAGRSPTVDDFGRLPYTRKVLSEALRLYPPVWMLERTAITDHEVDGYHIPQGSTVLVLPYIIQRDPRFWSDPDGFDPDRWTEESEKARPRYAYFPFGGGPRFCYGEAFAWMEATMALATIVQRWRLRQKPGHEVTLNPHVTIRPKGGLPMIAEARA
jgi:cytochrome P450